MLVILPTHNPNSWLFILKKTLASALFIFLFFGAACSGPKTHNFNGEEFFYPGADPEPSTKDHLKWLWEMETVQWPEWIEDAPQPSPPLRVQESQLKVTFVNHATVLIQTGGLNFLTDPIWTTRAGPTSFLGTKRVRSPGVAFKNLPPNAMNGPQNDSQKSPIFLIEKKSIASEPLYDTVLLPALVISVLLFGCDQSASERAVADDLRIDTRGAALCCGIMLWHYVADDWMFLRSKRLSTALVGVKAEQHKNVVLKYF